MNRPLKAVFLSIVLTVGLTQGMADANTRATSQETRSRDQDRADSSRAVSRVVRNGVQIVKITNERGAVLQTIWARPSAVVTPAGNVIDGGAAGIPVDTICALPGLRQVAEAGRVGLNCVASARDAGDHRRPRFHVKACKRLPHPEAHACWYRAVPKHYNRHHRKIVATDRAYISANGRHGPRKLRRMKTGWRYIQPTSPASQMPYKKIFDRAPMESSSSHRNCITVSGSVAFTPAGIGGTASVSFPLCRAEHYFPSDKGNGFTYHYGNWSKNDGVTKRREWRSVRVLASVMQRRDRDFKKWPAKWTAKRNKNFLF